MAGKEQRQQERERRDAERRAAQRAADLQRKLARSEQPFVAAPPPTGEPIPVMAPAEHHAFETLVLSPGASSVVVGFFGIVATCSMGVALVSGTPLAGGGWSAWAGLPLIAGLISGALMLGSWNRATIRGRVIAGAVCLVLAASFAVGLATQISLEGKPVLTGSTVDRSSRMATELLSDMLTLEDNQKLMDLAPEQGRGVLALYEEAAKQSSGIAQKWNPIVRKEVPLPGFTEVLTLVNRAADLQAGVLMAYRDQLNQADASRLEQIQLAKTEIMDLLAGPSGAAAKLSSTVAPVGIRLGGAK